MLAQLQAADSLTAVLMNARETVFDLMFWYGLGLTALRVVFILFMALVVLAVVKRLNKRWVARVADLPTLDQRRQRVLTVSNLLGSVARYVVWPIAAVMALAAVGFEIGPLLAGAGIAGLAIGFGAQTLVKDVISGFFLLFDDTIGVGDLITVGDESGTVEFIGLRLIKVRKFDGELLMVPAGELRTFGNKSMDYARAIVNVRLSYEQNVDTVLQALEAVAAEWAEREEAKKILLGSAPHVDALLDLGDSAVTARIVAQVAPGEQWQAERDLRRIIKQRFDDNVIELPFPRRTVYVHAAPDVSAEEGAAGAAGA